MEARLNRLLRLRHPVMEATPFCAGTGRIERGKEMQKYFRVITCAAMACCAMLPATAQTSAAATRECPIAATGNIGKLQALLGRRAVEIVERASTSSWKSDTHLRALLAPEAEFDLGSGDVGRPMGTGPAGAHALATEMKADSFRFLSWSSIPTEIEGIAGIGCNVGFDLQPSAGSFSSRILSSHDAASRAGNRWLQGILATARAAKFGKECFSA